MAAGISWLQSALNLLTMQTFIKYFNIITLKEMLAVRLQSLQDVLYTNFMYNFLFLFLLLPTGIEDLLIWSNTPEDGGYADGCWQVELNNL